MSVVDLNADLGESFGAYKIGCDEALLQIVSSANIACGFHGGDPDVMDQTIKAALKNSVRMGAHPGFKDLAGFGRRVIRGDSPEQIGRMILYQIGAFQALSAANGAKMAYVKLHGALSNIAMVEPEIATGFVEAFARLETGLPIMVMPNSALSRACATADIPVINEVFADRAYMPDGTLVPRSADNAVIHDEEQAINGVHRMLDHQCITAFDGTQINTPIDSICIHGDHPQALSLAQNLRASLEKNGVTISAGLAAKI
ncbi:LamB/YcsF family protein [Amylibacter marinus]|uniref:5-oxoprolinase subunit A n=1 Tax=Amylibacter marinus TaxID=1475483 RepID=A0ABQ5VU49_9RHOB|nr:5-oxoprolinase subunit PxpA [Amylibacter marinus]GLQ34697.1 LamB/YcsF family protein [Amylibacter marinus]